MKRLRIATRGSALARAQAALVAERIDRTLDCETELCVVQSKGDRTSSRAPGEQGRKGLFVRELEDALLSGAVDLAVHSAKDLPAQLAPGCVLAATPLCADPRDALVARTPDARLATLPLGARIGTGSLRRRAQLLAARPDLIVVPLRGNVDTRLRRFEAQPELDAILLACAGLDRLARADCISERIAPAALLPAVAQGTLAIETRRDDSLVERLALVDDAALRTRTRAERAFLEAIGGDCDVPLAAFAELQPDAGLRLRALVAHPDGTPVLHTVVLARAAEPEAAGQRAADQLRAQGADEVLARLRAEASR